MGLFRSHQSDEYEYAFQHDEGSSHENLLSSTESYPLTSETADRYARCGNGSRLGDFGHGGSVLPLARSKNGSRKGPAVDPDHCQRVLVIRTVPWASTAKVDKFCEVESWNSRVYQIPHHCWLSSCRSEWRRPCVSCFLSGQILCFKYANYWPCRTHQLGTIQELGTLIKQVASNMRSGLGSWSTTLFNGQKDATGKTIMSVQYFSAIYISSAYTCQQHHLTILIGITWPLGGLH